MDGSNGQATHDSASPSLPLPGHDAVIEKRKRSRIERNPKARARLEKLVKEQKPVFVHLKLRGTTIAEDDPVFQRFAMGMRPYEVEWAKAIAFCGGARMAAVSIVFPDCDLDMAYYATVTWCKGRNAKKLIEYLQEAYLPTVEPLTNEELQTRAIQMIRQQNNFKSFKEWKDAIDWYKETFDPNLFGGKKKQSAADDALAKLQEAASA